MARVTVEDCMEVCDNRFALVLLAANTLRTRPVEAAAGILVAGAGLPAFLWWRRKTGNAPES